MPTHLAGARFELSTWFVLFWLNFNQLIPESFCCLECGVTFQNGFANIIFLILTNLNQMHLNRIILLLFTSQATFYSCFSKP